MSIPSIPIAQHSQVPQWIFAAASKVTHEGLLAASSFLEAGFYTSLVGIKPEKLPRLVKWIQETCIAHIQSIQFIFNAIHVAGVVYYSNQLVNVLLKHFYSTSAPTANWQDWTIHTLAMGLVVGACATLGNALWKKLAPASNHVQEIDGVRIAKNASFQQKFHGICQIATMVLNFALTCLTGGSFAYALTFMTSGYTLLKGRKLKWISISRDGALNVPFPNGGAVTGAKATYNMLALPAQAPDQDNPDECPICMQDYDDENIRMAFCAHHLFCQTCIVRIAKDRSPFLLERANYLKTSTTKDGHTTHRYTVTISADNLPKCPMCNTPPQHNDLDVQVRDIDAFRVRGVFNASVRIIRNIDRQYLFENLYAIYNVVQAGLSYLQKYPELAAIIFKVQQCMLITDFIGYVISTRYAYKHTKAKLQEKGYQFQNSYLFTVGSLATVVAMAALSYYAVLQMNNYLKPAFILKDLLAKLPISPEVLQTIDISWRSPLSHRIMQALYINRIVSSLALSFFSKKRTTNLISVASQIVGMVGISQLRWIELTQLLKCSYDDIIYEQGRFYRLKSFKLISHFLVDPSCTKESFHLQSTVQSIYRYTSALLTNNQWSHGLQVIRNNYGVEVYSRLAYAVKLPNLSLEACGCTLTPNEATLSLSPVDYMGNVVIKTQSNGFLLQNFVRNWLSW